MVKRIIAVIGILVVLAVCYKVFTIASTLDRVERAPFGTSVGPQNAKNVIVEFLDYRCSHCRKAHPMIMEFAKRHPDVKIVFRHFPIFEAPSVKEADIALAAAKQGKFMVVHDYLMSRENPVEDSEIPDIARQFNLDHDALVKDMHAEDVGALLLETLDAVDVLKIDRAPSFLINKKVYIPANGMPDLAGFEKIYDQYRNK